MSGELDTMLYHLRRLGLPYAWSAASIYVWEAYCPCCRQWPLRLRETYGGHVLLSCAHCKDDGAIRWAFSADPLQWRVEDLEGQLENALGIAERARAVAAEAIGMVA